MLLGLSLGVWHGRVGVLRDQQRISPVCQSDIWGQAVSKEVQSCHLHSKIYMPIITLPGFSDSASCYPSLHISPLDVDLPLHHQFYHCSFSLACARYRSCAHGKFILSRPFLRGRPWELVRKQFDIPRWSFVVYLSV
jgi:hypothetical protein